MSEPSSPRRGSAGAGTMRAVFIDQYGKNDTVKVGTFYRPTPGPRQLLVQVCASSVNPIDWKIRSGMLKPIHDYLGKKQKLILGFDVSGIVVDKGAEVQRFNVGDEVFARIKEPGAFAEYVAADEEDFALKPSEISHAEAAAIPLVGLTSWQCLFQVAKVQAGQKVLIHAGSGGIGSFAIQLAKSAGCYVITTCGTANLDYCKSLGADEVIDHKQQDFSESLHDIDAVLDTVGGDTLVKSFSVVKEHGTVVTIAGTPDGQGMRAAGGGTLMAAIGQLANTGNFVRAWRRKVSFEYHWMHPSGGELSDIAQLLQRHRIKAEIGHRFPLENLVDAFSLSESGHSRGKIVIDISPRHPEDPEQRETATVAHREAFQQTMAMDEGGPYRISATYDRPDGGHDDKKKASQPATPSKSSHSESQEQPKSEKQSEEKTEEKPAEKSEEAPAKEEETTTTTAATPKGKGKNKAKGKAKSQPASAAGLTDLPPSPQEVSVVREELQTRNAEPLEGSVNIRDMIASGVAKASQEVEADQARSDSAA